MDAAESRLARMAREGELRRYRVLHFGTHALVDDEDPARSALILSQLERDAPSPAGFLPTDRDGLLTAGEIARGWTLDADLVTMSACETGLGRRLGGEGYVGLAHAFLQAGASSVLASLWPVDDRATALFVRRFYEVWTTPRAGPSPTKARALVEARSWLAAFTDETGRQPYAHPAYWAAFVLIGNGD
jgi:CHAT domain-containing protein